jgi:hypothetical protein
MHQLLRVVYVTCELFTHSWKIVPLIMVRWPQAEIRRIAAATPSHLFSSLPTEDSCLPANVTLSMLCAVNQGVIGLSEKIKIPPLIPGPQRLCQPHVSVVEDCIDLHGSPQKQRGTQCCKPQTYCMRVLF